MAPLEILIVGCSIAGPTLASFLLLGPAPATQKPHVTVLERSSGLRKQGQNIDIRGAGLTIIRKLGLEKAVRASTTGEEGVQFVDADNRIWGYNAADKSGKIQTPTGDIEILRGRLAEICYERSKTVGDEVRSRGGKGVEYIYGDHLDSIEQDGERVHVRFSKSGRRRGFDLVVGADGLQSSTRNLAWGPEGEAERVKRLGMYGGFFSMPRGSTDTMWRRWFHAPGRRSVMVRPDVQNGRTTAFMAVINDRDQRLPELALKGYKGVDAQKQLLREYFQDAGWECDRVLREMDATQDFYYDMIAQVKMDRWSKGRVVLLGDAGYCASPLSGMGTTLALNGAYNLAGAILSHPDDHTAAFSRYEQSMRSTVEKAQKLAPGIPSLLFPETEWGVWALNVFGFIITWTKLFTLLAMLKGPPANNVPVEDFGFQQLSELDI